MARIAGQPHTRRMFFTPPTILTWTRIFAIPIIMGVYFLQIPVATQNLISALLFIVFAITDWLDGFLARKLNMTSSFGAFLDPVAGTPNLTGAPWLGSTALAALVTVGARSALFLPYADLGLIVVDVVVAVLHAERQFGGEKQQPFEPLQELRAADDRQSVGAAVGFAGVFELFVGRAFAQLVDFRFQRTAQHDVGTTDRKSVV